MAGAFSPHLLDSVRTDNSFDSSRVTSGLVPFSPNTHGTPFSSYHSHPFFNSPAGVSNFFGNESMMSEDIAQKIAQLQSKLTQRLGPEYVSQRQGPGGARVAYIEGWKIINLANEVFGFNGWNSSVTSMTTDYVDFVEGKGLYNVGVSAIVRVTLKDGTFREDVGYGTLDNSKQKGAALEKCKKEAVTDALKRAFRNLGSLMGNCLYDKSFINEVTKMKVPPIKFNPTELHRRPEFEDVKPNIPSHTSNSSANQPTPDRTKDTGSAQYNTPSKPLVQVQNKPPSSIPAHIRSAMQPPLINSNFSPQPPPNTVNQHAKPAPRAPIPAVAPAQRQPTCLPQSKDRSVSFSDESTTLNNQVILPPEEDDKPHNGFDSDEYVIDDDGLFDLVDIDQAVEPEPQIQALTDSDEGLLLAIRERQRRKQMPQSKAPRQRSVHEASTRLDLITATLATEKPVPNSSSTITAQTTSGNSTSSRVNEANPTIANSRPHVPGGATHQQQRQAPQYTAGMKRPAETMMPNQRNVRPGMGLKQASANGCMHTTREVLGRLDISEGGDVKRMRT